jgi:hypothetical protein
MFPAIYGRCPQPIVKRTFNDKDPIGRSASSILERALHNDLETDNFHESVGSAAQDASPASAASTGPYELAAG